MKVLFPFVGDSIGGSHWSVINLYKELVKISGVDPVIVLHISDGPLSRLLDRISIPYTIFPVNKLAGESDKVLSIAISMIANLLLIYRFIQDNKVDIVHGNDLRINLTWSLPTRLSSSRYIWHQRQLFSKSNKWNFVKFLSDYVISISMYVYKTVPTNISNNKSLIVNNPFDISVPYDKKKSRESTCLKFGIDPSCFLLGYIGRLVSWKNIDTILYSLCEILSSTSYKANIHLIIAGDGDLEYRQLLTSIIKSNGLEKHVTFVGFVDDAPYILSAIDLLIASSINEPFGRVLVESILQKTLVLASNSGAHGDIIEHNKSGVLFEVSSIESLSRHILDIINNKDKHDHIIDFAYKNAINIYPSSMHADSIVKIYKHLIKDKG